MWAYRLEATSNFYGMTRSAAKLRDTISDAHRAAYEHYRQQSAGMIEKPAPPPDTLVLFDRDLALAKDMAQSLGWNGQAHSVSCFLLPGPTQFMYGFIITDAISGLRYVASPVALDYLMPYINWDAHTSTKEMRETMRALGGTRDPEPVTVQHWLRSRKGNPYTKINGAAVTIFPSKQGDGYCAIIVSGADSTKKVFTPTFQTETECSSYVIDNFHELTKLWAESDDDDNPFAGVEWGDDDP